MKFNAISLALICFSGAYPAMAADVGNTASSYVLSGYTEAWGGAYTAQQDSTWNGLSDGGSDWSGNNIGIAAYGSVAISEALSVQADGWREQFRSESENTDDSWTNDFYGTSIHLAYRVQDNFSVGVLGSYGAAVYDDELSSVRNFGLEASLNFDQFRVYAQAGHVMALSGEEGDVDAADLYGVARVTYFFSPGVAFSGWAGLDNYTADEGSTSEFDLKTFRFGGRFDYKPDGLPISVFAAASYWDWNSEYGEGRGRGEGSSPAVMAGFSLSPSGVSLQDLQTETGLLDMNPFFGRMGY